MDSKTQPMTFHLVHLREESDIPRMDIGSIEHRSLQLLKIPGSDWLRIGQLQGKHMRNANLIGANVWVRRYDGTGCVVHPFAHHVHAEEPLLLLQNLQKDST